jgi:hypothetical protein
MGMHTAKYSQSQVRVIRMRSKRLDDGHLSSLETAEATSLAKLAIGAFQQRGSMNESPCEAFESTVGISLLKIPFEGGHRFGGCPFILGKGRQATSGLDRTLGLVDGPGLFEQSGPALLVVIAFEFLAALVASNAYRKLKLLGVPYEIWHLCSLS